MPLPRLLGGFLSIPLVLGYAARLPAQEPQPLKSAAEAKAEATASASASETDPDSLAKYAPSQGLVLYLEFQGTQAHEAAWSGSAASDILSDTKTGAMLKTVVSQFAEGTLSTLPGRKLTGADTAALLTHALESGFMRASYGNPQSPTRLTVFRNAFDSEIRPAVAHFLATSGMAKPDLKTIAKGSRKLVLMPDNPRAAWWIEDGKDLVLAEDYASALDVLDGKKPNAVNDPTRQQLLKPDAGFEPLLIGFANVPENANNPQLSQTGLSGVRKLTLRWGPEGQRLKTVLHVNAPAPRKGLLTLIDQPPLSLDKLPPMPEGTKEFTAISLDPRKAYLALKDLAALAPGGQGASAFASLEEKIQTDLGKSLQDDILGQIGPQIVYYTASDEPTGLGALLRSVNPLAAFQLPEFVVMAELKDPVKFITTLNETMTYINETLEGPKDDDKDKDSGGSDKSGPRPAHFRMLSPQPLTYMLSLPSNLSKVVSARPTVLLGKKHLIIAATPDLARAAAKLEGATEGLMDPSGQQFQGALDGLPASLLMVRVGDPADSLPTSLVSLPDSLQMFINATVAATRPPSPSPGNNQPGMQPGMADAGSPPADAGAPAADAGAPAADAGAPAADAGAPPADAGASFANPGQPGANPSGGDPGSASPLARVRIQVPPDQRPDPTKIRNYIQPGCLAVAVDPTGLTIIRRQSFPDLGSATRVMAVGASMALPAIQASRNAARDGAHPPFPGAPAGASPGSPPAGGSPSAPQGPGLR